MPKRSSQAVSEVLRRWFGSDREPARQAEEHLFERFMRHLPGLAWLKDVSGKYVYLNEGMAKSFGMSPEEVLGKTNTELMSSEGARQCDESDTLGAHSDGGVRVVETYRHADGSIHHALVSKFPVSGTHDAPDLLGGIAIDITERVTAEERLRRSEERLRLATQTGKVGVWDWDIANDRIEWTGSLYAIHGVTAETFGGSMESFAKLVHPDDRAAVMSAMQRALAGEQDYDVEFRALRSDGSIAWLHTNAEVVTEHGKPVRMVGATIDLTRRKQTEIELRESEERFAKAFSASPLVLMLTSLETGRMVEVNDSFCRLTGHTREQAIGRTSVELGLWANIADREDELALLNAAGGVREHEYRFRKRDGSEWVGLLSAERIFIHGVPHALTVIQDITDRSLAVRALHASEERMRLALRGANAGAWVYSAEPARAFWSTEFRKLFGFGPEVACSLNTLMDRVHPEDRDSMLEEFKGLLRSAAGEFRQEFRIVHPELGVRSMLTLGRIDREDGVVHCHGISLDITRLKQVEDELRVADQRKNEFLATLAHELRNPLAPIRNGLEILRLTHGDGEMAHRAREMMERQLRQMVRLIDDLLDSSRISRGKIELKREPIELTTVVQTALEASRPLVEQAGHQLTVELASDRLFVHADATRLAQVFSNLLNNAAKYTNDGGHIHVLVKRAGADALVTVQDTGIGIPPDMLPKVFEMFTQVDRSLEKAQGGLGIGLSIAQQLIEMHGGSIEAHSDGPGHGSEFRVRLPLANAEAASAPHEQAPSDAPATALRILVADDNVDAASSLAIMLTINGHDVRTARDGVEAIEAARSFTPHAILLDIGMPRLNGYDACRQLRLIDGLANCLIVATTGWGQDDDIHRSREAGFDHHLVKPVEAVTLETLLAREFSARRLTSPDSPLPKGEVARSAGEGTAR